MLKVLAFILLLSAFTNVFAQDGNSLKERFDTSFGRGLKKFAGKSYRLVIISEYQTDGAREAGIKTTIETDGAGIIRTLTEFSPRLNKQKVERIRSGAITYIREGDGNWKQEATYTPQDAAKWREAAGQSEPANRPKIIEEQREYKSFGFEMLGDQNVAVGGFVNKSKMLNPADNSETLLTSTFKVWFGERETILKTESATESKKGEKITYSWRTEIYELDPGIKIKIPVLN